MPMFDPPVSPHLLWPIDAQWPKRRARVLLNRFQKSFPNLAYDMDLNVDLANAQAFLEEGRRRVRLFGGLVRHRKIGSSAIAVALAHETGHHLGGPPYLHPHRWLSSEERATDWAEHTGLRRLFGKANAARIYREGTTQLKTIGIAE